MDVRVVFFFFFSLFFFVFQAEDGIRDLVRSRGLGDVYKRQVDPDATEVGRRDAQIDVAPQFLSLALADQLAPNPVSYTHLTLPTSDLV